MRGRESGLRQYGDQFLTFPCPFLGAKKVVRETCLVLFALEAVREAGNDAPLGPFSPAAAGAAVSEVPAAAGLDGPVRNRDPDNRSTTVTCVLATRRLRFD